MKKRFRRTPRNYDGTGVTTHRLEEVLPQVLSAVDEAFNERPDRIISAWPDIIGPKLAPMTKVDSYHEGILYVIVKNSTLHSLLSQHDRPKLLQKLKQKFPKHNIRNIVFRMG
ncbi:MAG: DUF721 domain-containing protein [Chlamydiota bacterium]|nr:DUF721 domain-containing protein [Chlamydiota bacterium]